MLDETNTAYISIWDTFEFADTHSSLRTIYLGVLGLVLYIYVLYFRKMIWT